QADALACQDLRYPPGLPAHCIWHQWNPLPDPGYPVSTAEPFSPKDMSNLKRLVWMITTA
ncbi:hypothetical protein ACSRCJ_26895, partial [Salmonella enterica]